MTTKEIRRAFKEGRTIVLRDDPMHMIMPDIFGNLVVASRRSDGEPVRKATIGDLRRAEYMRLKTKKIKTMTTRKKIDKWFDEPQHVAGLTFVHIDTMNERGEYIDLTEPKDGMNDILYFDEMSGGQLRELRKFIEEL